MKTYKKTTAQKDELHMITCNRCAKIYKLEKETEEHLEVMVRWGYFSGKDGQIHKWDICEKCYDNFISEFKITPNVDSLNLL